MPRPTGHIEAARLDGFRDGGGAQSECLPTTNGVYDAQTNKIGGRNRVLDEVGSHCRLAAQCCAAQGERTVKWLFLAENCRDAEKSPRTYLSFPRFSGCVKRISPKPLPAGLIEPADSARTSCSAEWFAANSEKSWNSGKWGADAGNPLVLPLRTTLSTTALGWTFGAGCRAQIPERNACYVDLAL